MCCTGNHVPPKIMNEVFKLQRESYCRATHTSELIITSFDTPHFKMKYSSSVSSQIWRKDTPKASNNNALTKFGINSQQGLHLNKKLFFLTF